MEPVKGIIGAKSGPGSASLSWVRPGAGRVTCDGERDQGSLRRPPFNTFFVVTRVEKRIRGAAFPLDEEVFVISLTQVFTAVDVAAIFKRIR